jgi:DNA polymerase-3 subunit delta'
MIIGHQKIIRFLDKSVEKGKISHAYIFSGPAHLGKFTVALDFAKKITGGKNQKINPDIITIYPEVEEKNGVAREKDIKIEKIRELEKEFSLRSYFGKYKIAIIDSSEKLTISAQNSLLKILEEPPANCIIILICQKDDKLLPTIKSRCITKKFSLAKKEEMIKITKGHELEKEILHWSLNRPGLAVNLKNNRENLESMMEAEKIFNKISQMNLSERFELAENLSKNKKYLIDKLNIWMIILRRIFFGEKCLSGISPSKSFAMIQEIEKGIEIMENTNSNSRTVLENLLIKF